jgi:hypothetical protein
VTHAGRIRSMAGDVALEDLAALCRRVSRGQAATAFAADP